MVVTRRPLFYGLCLLIGVLLSGLAGIMHPLLTGDGAAQLGIIARTSHWRAIHWSLLFGLAFMYTGLIGVSLRHSETAGSAPGRAGILLAAFGFSVWSLNILFMAGAGLALARALAIADTRLSGTPDVSIPDLPHPRGLAPA